MFREILNALRSTDALGEMVNELVEMLQTGKWMFQKASDALLRKADWQQATDELYARDRTINRTEQHVREQIVTHLSVGHEQDIAACLVLMSVVKDAERIGDYCKNIFEVARFYTREYSSPQFFQPLTDIREKVWPLFDQVEHAFVKADTDKARSALTHITAINGTCDTLVMQLLTMDGKMPPDEAVAYVLLARFYKRVAAHLGNIATGVVSPLPMLDYRKPTKDEEKKD